MIVGELHTNVDASTFQFVDALIKANNNFELVGRPSVGHSAENDKYNIRKRNEFFVKHLLEVLTSSDGSLRLKLEEGLT